MPVNVTIREWEVAGPDLRDEHGLRGVYLDSDAHRETTVQMRKAGVLDVSELRDGLSIRAFAHVGRIQLGNVVITVEPKLSSRELLELLRYAYGLRNLKLFEATRFSTGGQLLQDLITAQLLAETDELVARGLARRYVSRTEALASPRGRIDMAALSGRIPIVDPAIPCRHHQRSADHVLNQVLLGGVALGANVACDPGLRSSLARLASILREHVSSIRLDARMLRRAWDHIDRLTGQYSAALELTGILLTCSSLSLDGEMTTPLPGFLFDMNRFFQALVGRLLRDHVSDYEVLDERGLSGMLRYLPHLNPRARRAPLPRPDFALTSHGATAMLLDAKYRDLWNTPLPRDMLYQLAMYAVSQPQGATVAMIYPAESADAAEARIEIRTPDRGAVLGYVALRPLILSRLVQALNDPSRQEVVNICRALVLGARSFTLTAHRSTVQA